MSETVDVLVIGAGVVGLAVARHFARRGRSVIVLEREARPGTGISARSSGVIHAGLYYPQGSLKASLCVAGRAMLYDYCRTRGVAHARCGKLVVAEAEGDAGRLQALQQAACRNGVADVILLSGEEATTLEPPLRAHSALHSPSTGIVDVAQLVMSLWSEAEEAGAILARGSGVSRLIGDDGGIRIELDDGALAPVRARHIVNAAGFDAPRLAATLGAAPRPAYAKGNYFALRGKAPFSRLIYPLPEPGGLGIHLTLDLMGQARFGPDVEWVEAPDYTVDPSRRPAFEAAIRRYWPELGDDALVPDYAGVRPKLTGTDGDFQIVRHGTTLHLLGIESPGITAALALARHVGALLDVP